LAQAVTSSVCPSLLVPLFEHHVFGDDFETFDPRIARRGRRLAGGDPFGQHAILVRVDLEAQPALVRDRARRLEQDQAPARIARHDSPPAGLPRDRQEVGRRIVSAERQLEAVLPRGRPVAGPRVAARFRQHRLHVIAKTPGLIDLVTLNRHLDLRGLIVPAGLNRRFAVADGNRDGVAHPHDLRVARIEHHALRCLPDPTALQPSFDDEGLPRLRSVQNHRVRQDG
jgi:hypothetical protein